MKSIAILSILCMMFSLSTYAQTDTIAGVLRDRNDKGLKNYIITVGEGNQKIAKTNKNGAFQIPDVNLQDTLYLQLKKGKSIVTVPLNGHNYVELSLYNTDITADLRRERDKDFERLIEVNRNKMHSSEVISKNQIVKSGCRDILCLLRRFAGVQVQSDGSVIIRGSFSFENSTAPLVVVDGIQMGNTEVLKTYPIEQVEEITVLKEGGEYGLMGANGVIIIKSAK